MSTSTASASAANLPSDSRSRPLRRLSQLRSFTSSNNNNNNNNTTTTNNNNNSNGGSSQRSSYRNSLTNRVPWLSSSSHQQHTSAVAAAPGSESATTTSPTNASHSCPESERQSTLARYSSVFSSNRGIDSDRRSQNSSSSRETPTSESGSNQQPQGAMARLRGLTQTGDSRCNNENASNNNATTATTTDAPSDNVDGAVDSSDPAAAEDPSANSSQPKQKPTIRFFPYQDPLQNSRPSLTFIPISRTLPSESCVIRVGRYSERDGIPIANPSEPSDAPIGFKSKVVSRKHCELIFMNGQWHIKDVGSSSGTFLNHMRLSQPNMTSKLYTVKDGDIIQLGIDFRGGEEMIFRCVRIRIECNRSWQRQPNEFNKNTESLIKNLGKGNTADYSGCRECSICLGSVLRPYQCLFMAACAHVWHYKCVSRLIHTPDYPIFQCPNCRAYTDLSAEVDDTNDFVEDEEEDEQKNSASEGQPATKQQARSESQSPAPETNATSNPAQETPTQPANTSSAESPEHDLPVEAGLAVNIENMHLHEAETPVQSATNVNSPTSAPTSNAEGVPHSSSLEIPGSQSASPSRGTLLNRPAQLTLGRADLSDDNPLTPRNDSGPLAFDGWTGIP